MKQQLIQTTKATILVVDLPEGVRDIKVFNDELPYISYFIDASRTGRKYIEPGQWQLLGKTFELSEELWRDIVQVKKKYIPGGYGIYFLNQESENYDLDTATESGLSLLTANKVNRENPYGDKEPKDVSDLGAFTVMIRKKWQRWKEAEQHVYRNPYTLIKI